MLKLLGIIFCIIGFGWAAVGFWNIILSFEKMSEEVAVVSFFISTFLFVLPGFGIGGKGIDWIRENTKKPKLPADPPASLSLVLLAFTLSLSSCADQANNCLPPDTVVLVPLDEAKPHPCKAGEMATDYPAKKAYWMMWGGRIIK